MINITDLTKKYSKTTALNHISLTIDEDGIYCLLGRNGAGKTTMLKLIAGHISADTGTIIANGKTVSTMSLENPVKFYESRTSYFNISVKELIETAKGLNDDFDEEFASLMVKRFHLDETKKYKQLSFGMQTMVTALLSLSSNSRIILLDEPVLGFDSIMRKEFYDLLLMSYEKNPRIIIVSTHLIDEIAKVAQKIIIIDKGQIILTSSIEDINEKAYNLIGPCDAVLPHLEKLNVICKSTMGKYITATIFDERIPVSDNVSIQEIGLQDFFVNLVGGGKDE